MIKLGHGLYVDDAKLEIFQQKGRKKEFWCRCKDTKQMIRFISKQLVVREHEGDTMSIAEYEESYLKKIVVVEELLYDNKQTEAKSGKN